MLIGVILVAAAISADDPLVGLKEESENYLRCIQESALNMEPSGEEAPIILEAALADCRWARERAETVFTVELMIRGENPSAARIERAFRLVDDEYKKRTLPILLKRRTERLAGPQ